ncbi:sigma 54-interacting transcriptional regulator [Wukongibacter baidiensis]|uniref:sigma-54 interaction domain-containing protein n=1 Tax=Wukongibacter baidiensis TaxID=1723361 RepID=UPI003D7F6F7A
MKSLAIVTDSILKEAVERPVGRTLKQNIKDVFGDYLVVNNYYIDLIGENDRIEEDIVLTMASNRAIKISKHVKNPQNIIVAERTFLESNIYKLFSIPPNSDVLLVNDDIETVLDVVTTLYKIGIKHLNLVPYEKGKDYRNINIAITPSECELVPNYIENVIDIGTRVIDVSTMLLILNKLNINEKIIHQNLYNYFEKIISRNIGIKENYKDLVIRTDELDCLLDLSNDGILLTSENGEVILYNKTFKEMFNIHDDFRGQYIHDVIKDIDFVKYYSCKQYDDLIIYKNRHINLHKTDIIHFNKKSKMYFNFQEITYIKKLEQNLSQKLRQKGQVAKYTFDDIITQSDNMLEIIEMGKKIAKTDLTVLITGDSGTGKEVLAQAIHNDSKRSKQPFVAFNCAAMPESLLESELFGYASGAFTGALKEGKKGLFEQANNGTIFLDEIGDMPLHLQTKLLRVLQERQIMPIGSHNIIDIDVRVIAATHRNLMDMVDNGSFRKDLFYRINVFPIHLPSLRKRKKDVLLLLKKFTNRDLFFTKECKKVLTDYTWPGNIRELMNIASYIGIMEDDSAVTINNLPHYLLNSPNQNTDNSLDSYQSNLRIINEKTDIDTLILVLDAIKFLNTIKKSSGRKHIINVLDEKGLYMSENKLRKFLEILKETEMVIAKTGRIGHIITEKGDQFLEKYHANLE